MTTDELEFSVFCIECVADELGIDGKEVYRLMTTCPGLNVLDDYVVAYYDTLHTQGEEYIVRELLEVMRKRGVAV
ncbi:transcriptional regulator [Spirochaetia bacterium]|nr:transcriptional regulator [Spirochaetia bacterium]